MTLGPRKLHDLEVECQGIPFCRDCVERSRREALIREMQNLPSDERGRVSMDAVLDILEDFVHGENSDC